MWYMDGKRTSVYLTPQLAAAVKASGLPLATLLRRALELPPEAETVAGINLLPPAAYPWAQPDADVIGDILGIERTSRPSGTDSLPCPHPDGQREHGPGAGWYCGICGTNLPAPVAEPWSVVPGPDDNGEADFVRSVLAEPGVADRITAGTRKELAARRRRAAPVAEPSPKPRTAAKPGCGRRLPKGAFCGECGHIHA
jgi:hypothetical protein